ncbi:cytochrome P450 71A1-like [Durio zibethinus]|uniref:Cytochrome P450 71A1-like n=1 Tax=Durio zibethinus TaxID=66656 RepID=A0A6P5YD73_DURZI|nr:cytochrome P450 71A1-like [Durio zibethinus]
MWLTPYTLYSWLLDGSTQKDGPFRAVFSFLIAMLAISLWHLWTNRKSNKPIAPLPPGPRGLPIVGYLPFLGTDNLHLVFTELAGVYGPIFKLWLGNKLCVVITSPSLAKEVVRDHDITFSERDPPIAAQVSTFGCNDIAFDSYSSPTWKKKRKILVSGMLSSGSLNAFYGLRKEQVMNTIGEVYKNVGEPIDVGELSYLTAINAVTSMVWGGKLGGEKRATIKGHFKEISSELAILLGKPNVSDIFPAIARFDIQGIERGVKKVIHLFNQLFDSVIELRTNVATEKDKVDGKSEQKSDFLQMLLELNKNEHSASSITMNQVKGMLMDIVVGGTDTTSTMVEWTMAELIQHTEIMEKVKKELTDVVGLDRTVEEFHLPNLRYLNAVIKETFRLHPALPLLVPRCSGKSITVGGYTIPKGSRVFLNIWSIHRDPHIWDNPLQFQPDRFLNDPDKFDYYGSDFRYMPFGSGRRKCPGLTLGEKMLYFILASLLHSFDWKLPQGTEHDLSSKFGLVVKKKKPLLLIPTPRLPNLELYRKKQL